MSLVSHYEIYRDELKQYRWRLKNNGRIIADSAEGYIKKSDCQHGIDLMKASSSATIVDNTILADTYLKSLFQPKAQTSVSSLLGCLSPQANKNAVSILTNALLNSPAKQNENPFRR